jgi:hypothetical protein
VNGYEGAIARSERGKQRHSRISLSREYVGRGLMITHSDEISRDREADLSPNASASVEPDVISLRQRALLTEMDTSKNRKDQSELRVATQLDFLP